MWTRDRGPELFPTVYCTLRPLYSGNLSTLKYGHWSHAPTEKINTNFPLKVDSLIQDRHTGVKELKNICHSWRFWPFLFILQHFKASLHSRNTKLSSTWHMATGKSRHVTRCTLRIKDTSLLQILQGGPAVSVPQRFHCITIYNHSHSLALCIHVPHIRHNSLFEVSGYIYIFSNRKVWLRTFVRLSLPPSYKNALQHNRLLYL